MLPAKIELVYSAQGGYAGNYRFYGKVWAADGDEARARFMELLPADRLTAWQADRPQVARSLGNSNKRKLDAAGKVVYQVSPEGGTLNEILGLFERDQRGNVIKFHPQA